jgi:hypothetical protein
LPPPILPASTRPLDGEVFQEQGVHGPFQANMKLVDLALRESDDLNAREAQPLEYTRHVFLIAADAVQRLGQHHVKLAGLRIGQQRLDAGTDKGCAGDSPVGIALREGPAFAGGALTALAQLVLDGCIALVVGGITGVERNTGHGDLRSISL